MKRLKNLRFVAGLALILVGLILVGGFFFHASSREIAGTELDQLLQSGALTRAAVIPTPYAGIYHVETVLNKAGKREKVFVTTHLDEAQVRKLFAERGVHVEMPGAGLRGQWVNIISTVIIAGLVIMLVIYQTSIGKGRDSRIKQRPTVSFRDVAGVEEAKSEVQEIVDFLRDPKKYQRVGGTLPKGVLLIGPPGTGKTMLAKAIACEPNANFFSVRGSDFTEVFVGVGAKRVRQLFRQAAKSKPAIIFIDEIDCVGKNRKFDTHGEHQQTIEALLRPGRFDRKVYVPYPDMKGRRAILESHAKGKSLVEEQKVLDTIAQTT